MSSISSSQTQTAKGHPSDLIYAIRKNDYQGVKMLLDAGFDPNIVNDGGNNACLAATFKRNEDILRLLISRGANCDIQLHAYNQTPLWVAFELLWVPGIKILLESGANPRRASHGDRLVRYIQKIVAKENCPDELRDIVAEFNIEAMYWDISVDPSSFGLTRY